MKLFIKKSIDLRSALKPPHMKFFAPPKTIITIVFLIIQFVSHAESLYEIRFTDKQNTQYKGLLVYSNDSKSYMRINYAVNNQAYIVEINYKMIYGVNSYGVKYCMLQNTSKPVFISTNPLALGYYPDYFFWFLNNLTGKYEDLHTSDDSTLLPINNRKVDLFAPLTPSLVTENFLRQFFFTSELKYSDMKKICGLTPPIILKPLPRSLTTNLHLIIVANTYDGKIGKSCETDRSNLVNEFRQTANVLGIGFKDYIVEGDNFTKANVLSTLNSVFPGSNDVVIFIYRGHGFRWSDQIDKWPRLALFNKVRPSPDNSNSIALKEVKDILDSKGARLNIVLGDCCNDPQGVSYVTSNNFFQAQVSAATDVSKLRSLFINTKGSIISTAARPGEVSFAAYDGGYFTTSFISSLSYETSFTAHGATQWDNIFSNTVKMAWDRSMQGCEPQKCISQNGISQISVSTVY